MGKLFFITRILTFVGSAVRCFWEFLVCRMFKLPIEDIRCFKKGEMCSHIEHELVTRSGAAFMMAFFPMIMNFILGTLLVMYSSFILFYLGVYTQVMAYVTLYAGISLWCNLFPSFEDALALKSSVYGGRNIFLKIILAPITAVSLVGSTLERFSVTILTTVAAVMAFPYIAEPLIEPLMELKMMLF